MKAAAIAATLVDIRNVMTHKVVRLEIHVPVEQAGMVMDAFGWPTAVSPVPVAIARLNPEKEPDVESPKAHRSWNELTLPEQAGIRCQDMEFRRFLRAEKKASINDANDAAEFVRGYCEIGSRAELSISDKAARQWRKLDGEFRTWTLPSMSAG